MTPKKKAEQLVNKYFNMPMCESIESAKYAAKICVNEILDLGSVPSQQSSVNVYKFYSDVKIAINSF